MEKGFNVPVALIFFTRPDTFEKVFEQVRKARPKKLFLIQDGARENRPDDVEKINECRKIAENIDWECEVYKNYSDINLGCGERPASGISWVFEHVDRAIILEDDCVPCETFFPYCEEMLEKYKDDERIGYISGLNHFEEWDCGEYSYFFAKTGAIWGWATWKRAWNNYDYYVNVINDNYNAHLLPYRYADKDVGKQKLQMYRKINDTQHNNKKLSFWDMQWGCTLNSQNQIMIVPKYNQISNIGVGSASSHAQSVKHTQFKKFKNFFFIPTKNLEFPLVYQEFCVCDVDYDKLVFRCTYGNPIIHKVKHIIKKIIRRGE